MARLVVIAPGRGSYNRTELGYLNRFSDHPRFTKRQELREIADAQRARFKRPTVSEFDNASSYRPSLHLPGENASALIFTCSAADYAMIDPAHKISAVLGNSMGWYTTLYLGGALNFERAFRVMDTMGYYQKENLVGAQAIFPLVDENWRASDELKEKAAKALAEVNAKGDDFWVGPSIHLGGLAVYAGTEKGIKALLETLPKVKMGANEYPFQLPRHGAFHTDLMQDASSHGQYKLHDMHYDQPKIPMIDGRGWTWRAHQTGHQELVDYTLVHQVLKPYDFTASVRVALREHNPDHLVLLGPGESMGGAIAQVIISEGWKGIASKADFIAAQKSDKPPLISMNRPEQAALVI